MIWRTTILTSEGAFNATFSGKGLTELWFPGQTRAQPENGDVPETWKKDTAEALNCVLKGEQPKKLPPLDLSRGTAFQQEVWQALLAIPAGKTRSYSDLAKSIGAPRAARAVGGACGANPIPLLIPCHRVLAAKGRLGGFSAGLKWKRLLLEREGVKAP